MKAFRKTSWGLAVVFACIGMTSVVAAAPKPDKIKPGGTARPALQKPVPSTPAAAAPGSANVPLLPGAGSKEPVSIDAGKLDYFDKEQKLVYTDDVVAVQGDSTLKASVLTIFLQKKQDGTGQGGATAPAQQPTGLGAPGANSSVSHMEAQGPVTLVSKDQIGTGDNAVYDKTESKVYLNGNVTLSQGSNVTQGDRLIYDLANGQAQVFSGDSNPRVKSVFTPGAQADEAKGAAKTGEPTPNKRKPAASSKTAARGKAVPGKAPPASPPDATAEQ